MRKAISSIFNSIAECFRYVEAEAKSANAELAEELNEELTPDRLKAMEEFEEKMAKIKEIRRKYRR